MKILMTLLVLFTSGLSFAFECDSQNELKGVKTSQLIKSPAREFHKKYDLEYEELMNSIKAIQKQTQLSFEKAHDAYLESKSGQRIASDLRHLKEKFGYDAVSAYLFDSPSVNKSPVFYTHTFEKNSNVYYLNGNRVVAVLHKTSDDDGELKVFTSNCSVREVVDFSTLQPEAVDTFLTFKVNKNFCSGFSKKKLEDFDQAQQEKASVYFNLPDNDSDKLSLVAKMADACQVWSPTGTKARTSSKSRGAK